MPTITDVQYRQHTSLLASYENDRSQWVPLWKELSNTYLPQRYRWLMSAKELSAQRARRQYIINNTGTQSARTLAAGMMNGITSPSRPWFKLRVPGLSLEEHSDLAQWLEEVERRLMRVMAESNFYNSMAVLYLDMVVFGTAASLIYEDRESVIRCYNPPLGEYYLGQSSRMQVNTFARKFNVTLAQYLERWPNRQYWSDYVKLMVEQLSSGQGAMLNADIEIAHFIGPNVDKLAPRKFSYYEMYWESRRDQQGNKQVSVLEVRGFNELPGIFARWELSGSDAYGVSPGMDALGDNISLQHQERNEAELLEKTHKPPILADVVLQNNPMALLPNGVTWVPSLTNTSGARPIYTVDARFDQLNIRMQAIEQRIRDTFFNFLFTGVTDLQTVRSAAEIDARETEKLILLGGVLERFESEGLDPAISRIYSITSRAGLLPEPPPQYANIALEIQYVSILSIAQRAVGTAPTERFLALVGNLAAIHPEALNIPKFDRMLTNYALDIGVRQSELNTIEEMAAKKAKDAEMQASAMAVQAGSDLAGAAKNLSATDVGGGANALQHLMNSPGFRPLG